MSYYDEIKTEIGLIAKSAAPHLQGAYCRGMISYAMRRQDISAVQYQDLYDLSIKAEKPYWDSLGAN